MELACDARLLLLGCPPRFLFALALESLRLRLELRRIRTPRPHVVAEDPGGGQRNHPRRGKQHVVVEPQNGPGERDDGRGRCAQGDPPRPVRRNGVDASAGAIGTQSPKTKTQPIVAATTTASTSTG